MSDWNSQLSVTLRLVREGLDSGKFSKQEAGRILEKFEQLDMNQYPSLAARLIEMGPAIFADIMLASARQGKVSAEKGHRSNGEDGILYAIDRLVTLQVLWIPETAPAVPPRGAQFLLLLIPRSMRENLLGDLEEEYRTVLVPQYGEQKARNWYWWQVLYGSNPAVVVTVEAADWLSHVMAVDSISSVLPPWEVTPVTCKSN